jgi:hypothetical protein
MTPHQTHMNQLLMRLVRVTGAYVIELIRISQGKSFPKFQVFCLSTTADYDSHFMTNHFRSDANQKSKRPVTRQAFQNW